MVRARPLMLFDRENQWVGILGTFGKHLIVRDDLVLGSLHFNQVPELVWLARLPPFGPFHRPASAIAITFLFTLRIRLRIRFFSPPAAFSTFFMVRVSTRAPPNKPLSVG